MKVIFALGNPGAQYDGTRHNVGFRVLDYLATDRGASFSHKPKFHAHIAELAVSGEKVLLVKPTTFYNEVGTSARAVVDFYKLDASKDLLTIHDDLALPFGTIRVRRRGSSAGNNGIKSLNSHLGEEFYRLRIGIYNDLSDQIPDSDFVLTKFTKREVDMLADITVASVEILEQFCAGTTDDHSITMPPTILT